ncbi:MAG TPA: hypothetical protein VJ689_13310, partial [Gaiellaceae bacterium]|nr:hypothetical protein [Gaiellaceae bacterium]
EDFGDVGAGSLLRLHVAGEASARSYLPVEPAGAEVVAIDGHGRPALLRHRRGDGCTVFCTYPLEHMAARTPRVNPEPTWRLYAALAALAGVERPVRVDDPRVLAGRLRRPGAETVLLVNCSADEIVAEPLVADGAGLRLPATVELEPFGIAVFHCETPLAPSTAGVPTGARAAAASEGRDARR